MPVDAGQVPLPLLRSRTMLLLSAAAMFNLVQFPFSAPIYFCYVAPLVALLALALFRHAPDGARGASSAHVVLHRVRRHATEHGHHLFHGLVAQTYPPTASLGLPRDGLDVAAPEAEEYGAAVKLLEQHARGGYTWASPDSAKIYFLSGLRNPTRTLFDFFDDDTGRRERIPSALDRHGVTAIALNAKPRFSARIPKDLVSDLEARYPFGEKIGKFEIRWK